MLDTSRVALRKEVDRLHRKADKYRARLMREVCAHAETEKALKEARKRIKDLETELDGGVWNRDD